MKQVFLRYKRKKVKYFLIAVLTIIFIFFKSGITANSQDLSKFVSLTNQEFYPDKLLSHYFKNNGIEEMSNQGNNVNFQIAQQQQQNNVPEDVRKAIRLLAEAIALSGQGTAENLQLALTKAEEALSIFQALEIRQPRGEGIAYNFIGSIYNDLENKEKALENYQSALSRFKTQKTSEDNAWVANILNSMGSVNQDLGNMSEARKNYEEAREINEQIKDTLQQSQTLSNLGNLNFRVGKRQEAIENFNDSLDLLSQVIENPQKNPKLNQSSLRKQKATTVNNIGRVYDSIGKKEQALKNFDQALSIYNKLNAAKLNVTNERATTISNIGLVYVSMWEKQKALNHFNQALTLFRESGNHLNKAATISNIGSVYSKWGEKDKALNEFEEALKITEEFNAPFSRANILNNIGEVYSDLADKNKALEYYEQALEISENLEDKAGVAVTLSNIGSVSFFFGEMETAKNKFEESRKIREEIDDANGQAETLNKLGGIYAKWGEMQKALDSYNQAKELFIEVKNPSGEAQALNNIASVYSELADYRQALFYYEQAKEIAKEISNRNGEATTLNNIGSIYHSLAETVNANNIDLAYSLLSVLENSCQSLTGLQKDACLVEKAKEQYLQLSRLQYEQSLAIKEDLEDTYGKAITLNNIGYIASKLGEKVEAQKKYQEAFLIFQRLENKNGEAITLNNIGLIYSDLGDYQQAFNHYNKALNLRRDLQDLPGQSVTLYNIAFLQYEQHDLESALTSIKEAAEKNQFLRKSIKSDDLRISYFATVQDTYELYIDILMALHQKNPNQGYNLQALEVTEEARGRSIVELLERGRANIQQGIKPDLKEKEERLLRELSAKTQTQQQLFEISETSVVLRAQLKYTIQEISKRNQEWNQLKEEIQKNNPQYVDLKYPQPPRVNEIQKIVDKDSILLSYWLGTERSYLWAVTYDSINSYELPSRNKIAEDAKEFFDYLTITEKRKKTKKAAIATAKLTEILLGAVAKQIEGKRILLVADATLQRYVPFSALFIPGSDVQRLLEEHEIVNLPTASTLISLRRQNNTSTTASKMIAAMADPVFSNDDPRLKVKSSSVKTNQNSSDVTSLNFSRLDYSTQEAEEILNLVPKDSSKGWFGFDVNRENIQNPELSQYKYIHLSTHGFYNDISPQFSGIALSLLDEKGNQVKDGILLTPDIYNLHLSSADLVVLSACRAGVGKEVKGEGLVGLTRGFMYAGAKRAIVTLWSVKDESTSELMKLFYQKMLQEKLSPGKALRAAQLEIYQNTQWKNPFYWSAFVIQGEPL